MRASHLVWEWFAGWVPQLRAPMKWAARASRLRGKRRKQEEVIGREDGDTYIAVFCDLQICGPLEKRRRHLCYFGNETNLENSLKSALPPDHNVTHTILVR